MPIIPDGNSGEDMSAFLMVPQAVGLVWCVEQIEGMAKTVHFTTAPEAKYKVEPGPELSQRRSCSY